MLSVEITRTKAFVSHLIFSLAILAVLLHLLTQHWYPGVFFHIDGGWDGLKIVLGCDIVLGPVLTLVVFKPHKKNLWFDLICIFIIQMSALTAGTWIVYKERPIALVYEQDRFFSLTRSNYTYIKLPVPDLSKFPGSSPKKIFVNLPTDPTNRQALLDQYKASKKLARTDINLYQPLSPNWPQVIKSGGITVDEMIKHFPNNKNEINDWLQSNKRASEDTFLIPISAASTWRFLYVDRTKPEILGITSTAIKPGI